MKCKMVLFDCDGTLWEAVDGDYISSVVSTIERLDENTIIRKKDNKFFHLKRPVIAALKKMWKRGIVIGIVSDNEPGPVMTALRLFCLTKYLINEAICVRLWQGHCRKDKMILEILEKSMFEKIAPGDTILVDDKDYSDELMGIGVGFVQVQKLKLVNNLFLTGYSKVNKLEMTEKEKE